MNKVSETFLLTIAQVSATLLGLLTVAAFSTSRPVCGVCQPTSQSTLLPAVDNEGDRRLYGFALPSLPRLSCCTRRGLA